MGRTPSTRNRRVPCFIFDNFSNFPCGDNQCTTNVLVEEVSHTHWYGLSSSVVCSNAQSRVIVTFISFYSFHKTLILTAIFPSLLHMSLC